MATLTALHLPSRVHIPGHSVNRSAVSSGVMVLLVYLFAGLPIQIGVMTQLGVPAPEASSWFFITWMTTGLFSLALSLFTRQPVSVNLSIPALVFLAGVAGGFSLPEILGANLVVGVAAISLSIFRLNEVFSRLVPPQIAIGVFAGGILAFIVKTAHLASADLAVAAPALGGFVVVYAIWRNHLLAVAVAAAAGFMGALASGAHPAANGFSLPQVSAPAFELDPRAIVALGIPLLVLTFGVGNLQAMAVLRSEGYRVRGKLFGIVAGFATVVNALGGGHAAAVGGSAMTLAARPAAGPSGSRFWAIVVSSLPVMVIALAAVPVIAIVQGLPVSYTLSIGAFALVAPLSHVIRKTVNGPLRLGGITAFVAAALPFQVAGMPMAFWAIVAGVAASAILEHRGLLQAWRTGREATE